MLILQINKYKTNFEDVKLCQ